MKSTNALSVTSGSAKQLTTITTTNSAIKNSSTIITSAAIKKPTTTTNIFRNKTSILFRRSSTPKKTPAVKIPREFLHRDAMSLRPTWDKRTLAERYSDFLAASSTKK